MRRFFCRGGDTCNRDSSDDPCLFHPAQRSTLFLKLSVLILHLFFSGFLFLFYSHFTASHPWYVTLYMVLFVATIAQYFFTSGSSPGYIHDALGMVNESNALATTSVASKASTCSYCNVLQPPRAKHCHDCDKCVIQFDHHCVWLGTCIGHGNHCRFWWYICEETILCLWTCILYVACLKDIILKTWWVDVIMIMLLAALLISLIFLLLLLIFHSYLIMTNQTTFELVRRRRIPYLRGIPESVYPFSKGVCRNVYNFCCSRSTLYGLEQLPTAHELEEKSRPFTCLNILSCCC